MADELKDVLLGGLEAKRRGFAGEDFAGSHRRAVFGRVKRRRAVSATAVGGASVLGVGAVAMGAAQVPWAGLAFGGPGSSPSVICTTTTPEATSAEGDPAGYKWAIDTEVGVQVYEIHVDGDELVVTANAGSERVQPQGDGNYRFTVDGQFVVWEKTADGSRTIVTVDSPNGGEVVTTLDPAAPEPSTEPVVTCVTETPAPSESASPMPTVSTSALPEPSASDPGLAWTWDPADPLSNPFQCGFVFPTTEEGTSELRVTGDLTTAAAIHATFDEWYGNQAPTTEVDDTEEAAYHATFLGPDPSGNSVSTRDPSSEESQAEARVYGVGEFGLTFVQVKNGEVVATVVPGQGGETPGIVVDGNGGLQQAFMWDQAALTRCGPMTFEGPVEFYAVAGYSLDGEVRYAWSKVTD